eukprot:3666531-Pyramimonas_sp.AAC.1
MSCSTGRLVPEVFPRIRGFPRTLRHCASSSTWRHLPEVFPRIRGFLRTLRPSANGNRMVRSIVVLGRLVSGVV